MGYSGIPGAAVEILTFRWLVSNPRIEGTVLGG